MDRADLELATVDDLGAYLVGIETEVDRLEQQRALIVAECDERKGHDVFGFPSTVAFLKSVCRMAAGRAKRLVKHARAGARHQATFTSWWCGQLSGDQAQQLFDISDELPDRYPSAEAVLLDICGDTPDETRQIINYWKHRVDPAGVELDLEAQMARRRFELTTQPNGMVSGRFTLTAPAGMALQTAVTALIPPPTAGDSRTATQRRHDAIEDLAHAFLETTNTRTSGGEKPHINVHVDVDALAGEPGGLHETTAGQVLPVQTIRQLACDSSITRLVFGPDSEVIDIGRKTRAIPPTLRRAVTARDRHCRHSGCRRPASWCDVHHIVHWADGGETTPDNLTLLCRYHHTLLHSQDSTEHVHHGQNQPKGFVESGGVRNTQG